MNEENQNQLLRANIKMIVYVIPLVWNCFHKYWFLIIFGTVIILEVYSVHKNFPDELRHLEPADWHSHQSLIITQQIKNLASVRPRVFNDTFASICEDLQIDSRQNVYCINQKRQIIKVNSKTSVSQRLFTTKKGKTYGLCFSKDQQLLYFVNSVLGLCQFDVKKKAVRQLVNEYQGNNLMSLNGVEVHPQNPNLLYITQSSNIVPMKHFNVDIFLGNAFGRVFEYDKQKYRISLLADNLHFPNGIVFQKYQNKNTILVAETSRFRIIRIYIDDGRRGEMQVAVEKLDIYPDNLKLGENSELFVGAMDFKQPNLLWFSESYWMRMLYSRIPSQKYSSWVSRSSFGGARITIGEQDRQPKIDYLLWNNFKNYRIASTMMPYNNNLYISSFQDRGIIMIKNIERKLKYTKKNRAKAKSSRHPITSNADDYFEERTP